MNSTSITDKLLLSSLNISQWSARKYDKRATRQITSQNHTSSDAGRFNKSLFPMNSGLNEITKKASSIRKVYYDNTLPWGMEGSQLMPSANYLDFLSKYRSWKSSWEKSVQSFIGSYSYYKGVAKRDLGGLYNEGDYPDVNMVEEKFSMDLVILPLPKTDFWVQSIDDELLNVQADVERRLEEAQRKAMEECWNRLYERVKHMADKLSTPDAIFRDSMVDGLGELCDLLPRLNFSDDPALEDMKDKVKKSLTSVRPEALRNDPALRRNKAREAGSIIHQMSAFMGEPK